MFVFAVISFCCMMCCCCHNLIFKSALLSLCLYKVYQPMASNSKYVFLLNLVRSLSSFFQFIDMVIPSATVSRHAISTHFVRFLTEWFLLRFYMSVMETLGNIELQILLFMMCIYCEKLFVFFFHKTCKPQDCINLHWYVHLVCVCF